MEADSLQVDKRRLGHAWACIMPAYFQMCADHTKQHGPGISIFKMLSQSERQTGDDSNCAFHFITTESPSWEGATAHIPNKEALMKTYDPAFHVMVAVHIPAIEGQDSTVGNVRIFQNELKDGQPVEVDVPE